MSKAKKILTLLSQGKTVAEVAKATKSAKNYVYYVRWTDAQKNKKSSAKKKPSKIIAAVKEMKTALDALEKERTDEARTTTLNKKPTKLFVQPKYLKPALKLVNESEENVRKMHKDFDNLVNFHARRFTKEEIEALDKDWVELPKDHVVGADLVNHPPHYKTGGIETIDFIEAKDLNYRLGNVIKYVSRAGKKGDPLEDLRKAKWYLEREIAARERA